MCLKMLRFSMVLFALLQTSWLAQIPRMVEGLCWFLSVFVHLRLWWLPEGLLIKVVAGLSGEEGSNMADTGNKVATRLP